MDNKIENKTAKIQTHLWFDDNAGDAVRFYASIFKNCVIRRITHYLDSGQDIHGRPEGSVMSVEFSLEGQEFVALNGGPFFKLNEAVSVIVNCGDQEELDYYWGKLSSGGDAEVQQCGWLKDKFGLSWQLVPSDLIAMMSDPDAAKSKRVMDAMFKMKKLDIAVLKKAFKGE